MSECTEPARHAPHGSPGDWWCVGQGITRYATPSLRRIHDGNWRVTAEPWHERVGFIRNHDAGWTAHTSTYLLLGLFPTKQAAAEVLVKQAGYELELT